MTRRSRTPDCSPGRATSTTTPVITSVALKTGRTTTPITPGTPGTAAPSTGGGSGAGAGSTTIAGAGAGLGLR